MNSSQKKVIMIIAGEASGDHHGARLVKALYAKNENLFFFGIGGAAMKDTGVKILVDSAELAVVGITEVLSKVPDVLKGLSISRRFLENIRPDLLILIDFPDFNLRIASYAKKLKIPVLYYISPQVWAWRQGRLKKIARLVDHMAVILPFEAKYYKKHGVPVTFVGHPLLDSNLPSENSDPYKKSSDTAIVGILPGSRNSEVVRHLPVMLDASNILKSKIRNLKFIVSLAPGIDKNTVEAITNKFQGKFEFEVASYGIDEVLKKCAMVMAVSGTVTLETAISGTPMVIVYKLSTISYLLGRLLIEVNNIGLVNLIAGKTIVPELIQDKASAPNIANTVYKMLKDPAGLKTLSCELFNLRELLGGQGASRRVADIAIKMLRI